MIVFSKIELFSNLPDGFNDFPLLLIGPEDLPRKTFDVGRHCLFVLAKQFFLNYATILAKWFGIISSQMYV